MASAKAGFAFAIRGEKPDPQSTIDLPVLSPNPHYYDGASIRLGGAVKAWEQNGFMKKAYRHLS